MSTPNPRPLHELVSALLDGTLSPEAAEELDGLLLRSAKNREEYRRQVMTHADFKWRHGTASPKRSAGGMDYRVMAELLEKAEQAAGPCAVEGEGVVRRRVPSVVPRSTLYAAVATTLAGLLVVAFLAWPEKPILSSATPEPVAVVVDTVGLEWDDPTLPGSKNARLHPGEYHLVSGLLEIEFNSGARVILEAPAEFSLTAVDRMRMKRGKVVGNVPPSAIGFEIDTPTSTIIDLGTAFGVEAKLSQTLIEVFEGMVEVDQSRQIGVTQHRVKLVGGHAARTVADVAGIEHINPGQLRFTRSMRDGAAEAGIRISPEYAAAVKRSKPIAYWRFETKQDGGFPNEVSSRFPLVEGGPSPVELSLADSEGSPANHVARFAGQSWLATPGTIEPFDETHFSIELWVYPNEYKHQTLVYLQPQPVGEGSGTVGAVALLMGHPSAGPIRRVRFSHANQTSPDSEQSVWSAAPYRLDSWQHIVAVKDGREQLLYINGDLAGRGDAVEDSHQPFRVVVGKLAPSPRLERSFIGRLDEIALYDRALGEEEVRSHYKLGIGIKDGIKE